MCCGACSILHQYFFLYQVFDVAPLGLARSYVLSGDATIRATATGGSLPGGRRLIASVPAGDQRVPHIWPSFGQMWETRTSNSKGLAHRATQFSRRHFSRCHSRGYEKVAFFPPPLKRVRVGPASAGRNPGRKRRKRRSCFVSGPDLKRLRKNDG
jgi:hypothetical protein